MVNMGGFGLLVEVFFPDSSTRSFSVGRLRMIRFCGKIIRFNRESPMLLNFITAALLSTASSSWDQDREAILGMCGAFEGHSSLRK